MDDSGSDARELTGLGDHRLTATVELVSAYVSNNSIRMADLAGLIEAVHATLGQLGAGEAQPQEAPPATPAVPIKKSITPEFLICLEDGKKFRSLKRHLGTVYGLTPDQYRTKWGLPRDYPMVAPAYSAVRSKLAKDIGLGRPARAGASVTADAKSKRGGRTRKAAE